MTLIMPTPPRPRARAGDVVVLLGREEYVEGEVIAALAERGIKVTDALVYFIKGQLQGRKTRKRKVQKLVAKVAETTGNVDALSTILKVKKLAGEVGGIKKLKALVEALSE